MQQHSHKTTPFEKKEFPLVIICDGVQGPANIGSLFRVADAFGVAELIFTNSKIDLSSPRMKRTARETYNKVNHCMFLTAAEAIQEYRQAGYMIMALEITQNSDSLDSFKWEPNTRLALVVGNEQQGVSEDSLELSDAVCHIEMFGENSSINVSHATAIALYKLTLNRK